MNAENPQPVPTDSLIDGVPGGVPTQEGGVAQATTESAEVIDSVPGVVSDTTLADRQGVVTPVGVPVKNGETISTTNNMRTPVLGRPAGMSVEAAHAEIRDQNARNAAGSQ